MRSRPQGCGHSLEGYGLDYNTGTETILLQLFGHPETSEWFSIHSYIIF